jgi:hypothetical protein
MENTELQRAEYFAVPRASPSSRKAGQRSGKSVQSVQSVFPSSQLCTGTRQLSQPMAAAEPYQGKHPTKTTASKT